MKGQGELAEDLHRRPTLPSLAPEQPDPTHTPGVLSVPPRELCDKPWSLVNLWDWSSEREEDAMNS